MSSKAHPISGLCVFLEQLPRFFYVRQDLLLANHCGWQHEQHLAISLQYESRKLEIQFQWINDSYKKFTKQSEQFLVVYSDLGQVFWSR
jgi:hypothetical protein